MPGLSSPQSQAGVMSFYDAPTKGPKLHPKLVLAIMVVIVVVILIVNHFALG
jgi:preprotein translocase subunit Sec61beta